MQIKEYQIAQFLKVAKEQIVFCEIISNYPSKNGKRNFDNISPIDGFYKSVCNIFFQDSLLIISSLLNDKDKRVISFWNWQDFTNHKKNELRKLTDKFIDSGLRQIRDQMIAHQDINNRNNNFPNSRRRAIIRSEVIKQTQDILDELIKEFYDYKKNFSTPYSVQSFDVGDAKKEIETVMDLAKPILTDNYII